MPRWVAEGLAEGLIVGGTCIRCGSLINEEGDFEGGAGARTGNDGGEERQGRGSEPSNAAERGELYCRGWGKQPRKRVRTRRVGRVAVGVCSPVSLTDDLFSCTCLDGHHPAMDGRPAASG